MRSAKACAEAVSWIAVQPTFSRCQVAFDHSIRLTAMARCWPPSIAATSPASRNPCATPAARLAEALALDHLAIKRGDVLRIVAEHQRQLGAALIALQRALQQVGGRVLWDDGEAGGLQIRGDRGDQLLDHALVQVLA